ncbi:hypothetical protein HDV02_006163 [Globomyces sp. JEL0801]|nr:hypothetical protein HDV02_006163 [Globomyces sp. JEL0801]
MYLYLMLLLEFSSLTICMPTNPKTTVISKASNSVVDKKGLILPFNTPVQAILKLLDVWWVFNYEPIKPVGIPNLIPFCPMVNGSGVIQELNTMNELATLGLKGVDDVLLGFYRPDDRQYANLTVEKAIELWPALVETGRRIGSPITFENPLLPNSWLRRFMNGTKQKKLRVNFVNIGWSGNSSIEFLQFINQTYYEFKKPVWITEITYTNGIGSNHTLDQVIAFMHDVIPPLYTLRFIERFSWSNPQDFNSTFNFFNEHGNLTMLGETYASFYDTVHRIKG